MEIKINDYVLTEDQIKLLLDELKHEGVKTREDLSAYLTGYWYQKDMGRKSHLLLSDLKHKRSFAFPIED